MASQMEIYFCEKKEKAKSKKIIWFFEDRIANQFLKQKWSEKLFILPQFILEPIYILFNEFKFFDFFLMDIDDYSEEEKKGLKNRLKQIDNKNIFMRCKPTIQFTQNEINEGEAYLNKIGFNNSKFFAFASRSSELYNERENSVRNSNINDFESAVNFLISKGYKAIRMGKSITDKINFSNTNIVDYATSSDRNDFLDIYLASKFEFIITGSTGITELGSLFRKPKLVINEFGGTHAFDFHHLKYMVILKKVKNLNSGKIIPFKEVYDKKLTYMETSELNSKGYELIDNSKSEIKLATENFLNFYNKNFSFKDILDMQKNFWRNIEKYSGFKNNNKMIVCPDFYKKNKNLFDDNI